MSKKCSKCKIEKPMEEFSIDRSRKDGRQYRCKSCNAKDFAERYAKDPQRVLDAGRRYRINNPEAYRASVRKYNHKRRAENPERCREVDRKQRAKNVESRRKAVRKWEAANPSKVLAKNAKRRAISKSAIVPEDAELVAKFYEEVKTKKKMPCEWHMPGCLERRGNVPKDKRHVDHIRPLSRGGKHERRNLCCACESCNLRKHNKLPEEFTGQGELFAA